MPDVLRLQILLATFAGWVNRNQAQAIDYLVEENRARVRSVSRPRAICFAGVRSHRPSQFAGVLCSVAAFETFAFRDLRGLLNATYQRTENLLCDASMTLGSGK